jgi:hypothetical protein
MLTVFDSPGDNDTEAPEALPPLVFGLLGEVLGVPDPDPDSPPPLLLSPTGAFSSLVLVHLSASSLAVLTVSAPLLTVEATFPAFSATSAACCKTEHASSIGNAIAIKTMALNVCNFGCITCGFKKFELIH